MLKLLRNCCFAGLPALACLAGLYGASFAKAQTARSLPAGILSPSWSWRSGALSSSVHYNKTTGAAQVPAGTAQVLRFSKDAPAVTQETFAQASSSLGEVKSSLTTIQFTVTVGSMTDDEGVIAKTLTFHPLKGNYRMTDNGVVTQRAISEAELRSKKFGDRTYAMVRKTDPNYGRPQEVLLLIDLGGNGKLNDSDLVMKYVRYSN